MVIRYANHSNEPPLNPMGDSDAKGSVRRHAEVGEAFVSVHVSEEAMNTVRCLTAVLLAGCVGILACASDTEGADTKGGGVTGQWCSQKVGSPALCSANDGTYLHHPIGVIRQRASL